MNFYRFTLFDSLEDDEFDGDIGVHDEEVPRVLLSFKIENGSMGGSQSQTASSLKYEEAEKDHQLSQVSYNASNWNGFNTTSLNQLLCPDEVVNNEITENRKCKVIKTTPFYFSS